MFATMDSNKGINHPFVNANPTSFPASRRLYTCLVSDVMVFIFSWATNYIEEEKICF